MLIVGRVVSFQAHIKYWLVNPESKNGITTIAMGWLSLARHQFAGGIMGMSQLLNGDRTAIENEISR